jgi:hypothetical protein
VYSEIIFHIDVVQQDIITKAYITITNNRHSI